MSPTSEDKQNENEDSDGNANAAYIPFAKRAVKKAPSPKHDELKERRRGMFLKKVQEGREARRFEARGEDVCYSSMTLLPR